MAKSKFFIKAPIIVGVLIIIFILTLNIPVFKVSKQPIDKPFWLYVEPRLRNNHFPEVRKRSKMPNGRIKNIIDYELNLLNGNICFYILFHHYIIKK